MSQTEIFAPQRTGNVHHALAEFMPANVHRWWTVTELVAHLLSQYRITASETGTSACVRDLRKLGFQVDRRTRRGKLIEYRCWPKPL